MWDIHKGHCVRLFTGHTRGVNCLSVSSNGRFLASGGNIQIYMFLICFMFLDIIGTVKIWDIADGKLLKSFSCESDTSK